LGFILFSAFLSDDGPCNICIARPFVFGFKPQITTANPLPYFTEFLLCGFDVMAANLIDPL